MSSDGRLRFLITPIFKSHKEKRYVDIGCGFGRWGRIIRSFRSASYLVGLDVWAPYLTRTSMEKIYDDLILSDARFLPFRKHIFDVCLACEIIEHLSSDVFEQFILSLENISKKTVIISTPNYEYLQDEIRGNPYEKHISIWHSSDFSKRGYKITGIGIQMERKGILCKIPMLRVLLKKRVFLISYIPIIGKLLNKIILRGRLTLFSELIVAVKHLDSC